MFKNCVFCRTHLTVPYNFGNFYVMIEFSGRLWVPNWHFSNFLCHCFDFLHGPWLFRTCYQTKIVSKCKCKFRLHYNIGSSTIPDWIAKVQNQLPNSSEFSQYLHKYVNMSFLNLMLLLFLFRSALARHVLK